MLLSQSTSSGLIVVEAGKLLCTDLASATPFAYPCSYNGDCFAIVGVVSDGAIEVPCGGDGASVPVVAFAADVVAFVGVGGIPHIRDSVVLTKLSFGSHIAAFCSGVNDDGVILFPWP
jgi:hypothetical protein